jgi:Winged helix DNA-binding domain
MAVEVGWDQVMAFRMRRHMLDPVGRVSPSRIVQNLCGVQSQVASSAELAIRIRRQASRPGEVARALSQGRLIRTWAMRGALHLLTPDEAGVFLSLIAEGRSWERQSWQTYFGATPAVIDRLREVVRDALGDGALTREEIAAAVTARRGLEHIGEGLRSSWGMLLKPLAWQGDLCQGPARDGRVTFMRPELASSRWAGLPDPEDAAPIAISAYLRAYGPATADAVTRWLGFGRRRIKSGFKALGDRLVEIDVDGHRAFLLKEDVRELGSMEPSSAVRLLPGFDQYVLGPGTGDDRVVPPARRAAVSRQAGWISAVVVAGGVVRGTWTTDGEHVLLSWFTESGRVPRRALTAELDRLSSILDRPLRLEIATTAVPSG